MKGVFANALCYIFKESAEHTLRRRLNYFVQIWSLFAFIIKIVSVGNRDTKLLLLWSKFLLGLSQVHVWKFPVCSSFWVSIMFCLPCLDLSNLKGLPH